MRRVTLASLVVAAAFLVGCHDGYHSYGYSYGSSYSCPPPPCAPGAVVTYSYRDYGRHHGWGDRSGYRRGGYRY